jgi:hypothetical protein
MDSVDTARTGGKSYFVNQKQYSRILKRRQVRMKMGITPRKPRSNKSFRYESRHNHAISRQRGPGGRFLSKEEMDALEAGMGGGPTRQTKRARTTATTQVAVPVPPVPPPTITVVVPPTTETATGAVFDL